MGSYYPEQGSAYGVYDEPVPEVPYQGEGATRNTEDFLTFQSEGYANVGHTDDPHQARREKTEKAKETISDFNSNFNGSNKSKSDKSKDPGKKKSHDKHKTHSKEHRQKRAHH